MPEPTVFWNPELPVAPVTGPHAPGSPDEATSHGVVLPRIREHATVRLLPGALVPGTRYRLRRWLGDGGMGVVYEAEHLDLERPVALKILRAQVAEHEGGRERFRKEARTTTRIASPHVVQVLDFGLLSDGRVFYAMELLDGRPLSAEIAEGPIAPARVIGLLRQMCAGLAAAHRSGVIHRDVKPDNTMLVFDRNGRACVKLLDFGISSGVAEPNSGRASGTPEYMAPEQIEGKAFDVRLDVYALGCTAYEMLTGHPPFRRDTTLALIKAHLEETPAAPAQEEGSTAIPVGLSQVVMRCLAKDPEDRHPSMEDLEVALCEAQIDAGLRTEWDDLPLPDIEPEARAKLAARMPHVRAPWVTRRRRWVAILTGVAATMVAGLWLASPQVDASDHARVEDLVSMTRAAADRGVYVYPPPGEATETAYTSLITLEHLEGPAAEAADEQAAVLRRTLADELVALGDGYWDDVDSRAYARDYYAQAVLFDPHDDRARDRAGLTLGELTELRARAETQDFTEPELVATAPLIALALVDEGERANKVSELAIAEPARPSSGSRRAAASQRRAPSTERVVVDEVPVAVRAPGAGVDQGSASVGDRPSLIDRLTARRLLRKAQRAADAGDLDDAQRLFDEVLALDPNNGAALRGLAAVSARRGKHERALQLAKRATRVDPRDAAAFVQIGDAQARLHRIGAARRAYARAVDLGDRDAAQRLRELD